MDDNAWMDLCDTLKEWLVESPEEFTTEIFEGMRDSRAKVHKLAAAFAALCGIEHLSDILLTIRTHLLNDERINKPIWVRYAMLNAERCGNFELLRLILRTKNPRIVMHYLDFENDDRWKTLSILLKDVRINPRLALKEELMQKVWAPESRMTVYFMNENDDC